MTKLPVLLALACLVYSASSWAQQIAQSVINPNEIAWQIAIPYSALSVTVTGPGDTRYRESFTSDQLAKFPLRDGDGQALPDGFYKYELVITPPIDADTRAQMDSIRKIEPGSGPLARDLYIEITVPTQAGGFTISDGSILMPDDGQESLETGLDTKQTLESDSSQLTKIKVPRDQVVSDDLIVDGSICAGFDCANNEAFGYSTIKLKENNTRITFDDTSTSAGYPDRDWQLTANDSTNGGAEKFSVEDLSAGRVPFTVEGNAPNHSLYIDGGGRIGNGTSNPVVEFHSSDGDSPTLRLEQNGSSGFSPQTWDVAGNETNFFVRDTTHSSNLPFRIRAGARDDALYIGNGGQLGIGTESPDATMELVRAGTDDKLILVKSGTDTLMELDSDGDMVLAGILGQLSSRQVKGDVQPVDAKRVLHKLNNLPLYTWRYNNDRDKQSHLGPMAEDFHSQFGLGKDARHIAPSDLAGVALATIQALAATVDRQARTIDELSTRIKLLERTRSNQATKPGQP